MKRLLIVCVAGLAMLSACRQSVPDDAERSRKTTQVSYLSSPVRLGDMYLRDNGGAFQISPDGGTWADVGSGSETASEYALNMTVSGSMASATFSPSGFFTGNTAFSLYGVALVRQLDRAESFYSHTETEYSTNVLNFRKTADNRLAVDVGANTYTSDVVFTSDVLNMPVEVGVVCDASGSALWFLFNGEAFASQSASYTFPAINMQEVHQLGTGLDGEIFCFAVSKHLLFNAGTKHAPVQEGLSNCALCLASYDMDEGDGSTLTDRVAEQKGSTAYDLTIIDGIWQDYARGY